MTRNATVTIRLDAGELDRLRAEATESNRSFSDLARERLGVQPLTGVKATVITGRLDALEDRVRQPRAAREPGLLAAPSLCSTMSHPLRG